MRWLFVILVCVPTLLRADDAKPTVAVFPIAGNALEATRERAAFALRAKLDRTGRYEVIDGPRMLELLAEHNATVSRVSTLAQIRELAGELDAAIVLWGELNESTLRMNVADLRLPDAPVQQIEHPVKAPTDLRFAVEAVLESLQGMAAFEHPAEQRVWEDELSRRLWKEGPDLLANGSFSAAGKWTGIYQSQWYPVPLQDAPPPLDKVAIVRGAGEDQTPALMLHLSKTCAENNGLACLSDPVAIKPNTRYRLSYKYRSDGPRLFVFVKGYTLHVGPAGQKTQREIYRRQAPVLERTDGKWVTIIDDFNPQHVTLPVQELRVDFYTYLHPGTVVVDEAVLKEVGAQTRKGKDDAIKPVATRPAWAK